MAMQKKHVIIAAVAAAAVLAVLIFAMAHDRQDPAADLPGFEITGSTDLDGNIFVSFVYTKNIIMFDGKGNIVWSKHEDVPDGIHAGYWDFKKHVIGGEIYYSYHDQNIYADHYGLPGYAPGERVILDSDFREVKRITFEQSDTVGKGHLLDGHDFLLIDLDHYILSGYIKDTVDNVPGYEKSSVVYSYLQEVENGEAVWDWRSIDYPELYSLTVTDAVATANDFGNLQTDAPDYVHFNAMRLNGGGDLVCSFRHLNTIMCLDRGKDTDQIKWKLSGNADEFGLSVDQKTSSQHYVTVDGDTVGAFDNHNISGKTRLVSYKIDTESMELKEFEERIVPGKFSSACGSQQKIKEETYMIGWGNAENDQICFSVYDFASDRELMSMKLANPDNFTYRCAYYA